MKLKAFGINCTLKAAPAESSTQRMLDLLLEKIATYDVETSYVRAVDHEIKPGVSNDEGAGDEWPQLRKQIDAADILVLATPIWLGKPSSIAMRVLERLDAVLGEIDEDGIYPTFGKVAIAGVVGNEDGAHHVCAELYQALSDVGFTIPAGSGAYWVGEAMGKIDFKDLQEPPDKVLQTAATLARNAVHLAGLLQQSPYPPPR